ncbi:MAG: hypothetical protein HW421_2029 [Ignavibacteria bacterium]|nr:hypothetical protein [Ignavibacteria bacterium]
MAVNIRIKGNKDTNEYKDALVLKQIFENEFANKDTKGEILIISNAILFGQEVKDVDLIVLGNFEKYSCKIKSKAETGTYNNKQELPLEERLVFINSFCFVIETKGHRAEDIQLNGVHLLVRYNDNLHDATTQSEKQKYSLSCYFKDRLNFTPYIFNFIWFRNISWNSIKQLLGDNENVLNKHNYLPNTFSTQFLFQLACVQGTPYTPIDKNTNTLKGYSIFKCLKYKESFNLNEMHSIFDLFEKVKEGVGQLTRKKIEQITKKLLDEQKYAQAVGEKFVIISGRAGTGKTIKLLRIACDLAISKGGRCLILTYNHALVSDIKRTLALAGIPDGIDNHTVQITTLHKFFYELLIGFGIVKNLENPEEDVKYIADYLKRYKDYLKELYDYIDTGLIQEKEIQELMHNRHDKVAWDYVLIDESQDWSDSEKLIIFRIFGMEKIIIADGIDQLIRSQKKCNWISGLKKDIDFRITHEKKGLRQEVNLVSFVNSYAKEIGIYWEIEPKQELIGGKIIISTKEYSRELHQKELSRCKEFGNAEYEMMFLVPPKLVNVAKTPNGEERSFKLINEFEQMGIKIWDSTSKDLRTQYVVDLSQHRLLQYESCRGLEGWTVVCLELDEFIKYKMDTFTEPEKDELRLETFQEQRDNFVYLWSLIPLTRAIDTIIITIKNKDSVVGHALRRVYEQNPDFIQWIE